MIHSVVSKTELVAHWGEKKSFNLKALSFESFCGSFMFLFCLVFAMSLCTSVYMCFVVTCWEGADLLALVCGVLLWVCHFPIGILGQVWYLIVSIPDLCTLTYSVYVWSFIKISSGNSFCAELVLLFSDQKCFHTFRVSFWDAIDFEKCAILAARMRFLVLLRYSLNFDQFFERL